MMMLIPEAWDNSEKIDPVKKAFYEYEKNHDDRARADAVRILGPVPADPLPGLTIDLA